LKQLKILKKKKENKGRDTMDVEWGKTENIEKNNTEINEDICITELEKLNEKTTDLTKIVEKTNNSKENKNE
jgi:hypothetical protein